MDYSAEELASLAVGEPCEAFVFLAVVEGNMAAAWEYVDPALQRYWTRNWANGAVASAADLDVTADEIADNLLSDASTAELWAEFSSGLVSYLRGLVRVPLIEGQWGIGTTIRVLAMDTQLVYLHPTPETWEAGTYKVVLPVIMRLSEGRWRVLHFGSDELRSLD